MEIQFLMVIGNIGNAFIIIIFGRQRKTACSIYLTSSAVVNSLFLTINFCFTRFSFDYSVETLGAITYCKVSAYVLNILGQVAKTLLAFACIDRFLITCDRASFSRILVQSNEQKYVIVFTFIFWSLLTLHVSTNEINCQWTMWCIWYLFNNIRINICWCISTSDNSYIWLFSFSKYEKNETSCSTTRTKHN